MLADERLLARRMRKDLHKKEIISKFAHACGIHETSQLGYLTKYTSHIRQ